jgi:hypothetical protein
MSNRVVVIRILGLNLAGEQSAAVLTTRFHPDYDDVFAGTVVSLSDQLSSEIQVFGSLGSDSTTSFTVLSTADTRQLLMSRGKREVLDPSNRNQPVRMLDYIPPDPGPVTIPVLDPSLFTVDYQYRVQNTVFRITSNSPTLVGNRVQGCAPVPIPMSLESSGVFIGSLIYDLNDDSPLGGCEQLPVEIETVDLDSSVPEVIFRGFINKVSNDTSSGQQNLIKVDCSSLMAYVKAAPFVPAWGSVSVRLAGSGIGEVVNIEGAETLAQAYVETGYNSKLYGPLYNPASPVTGATVSTLWQVRQEGFGGIGLADVTTSEGKVVISGQYGIAYSGTATVRDNGYRMVFSDGYYADGNLGPALNFGVDIQPRERDSRDTGARLGYYRNRVQNNQPGIRGENCIEALNLANLITDLLLGTYNQDTTFTTGARSASEAAWLPFPVDGWTDLIDASSLNAFTIGLGTPDVPIINALGSITLDDGYSTVLPYQHTSAKTVGEVLDQILKRLGAYMVYDKGKFYFGTWAGARQTPTLVNDSALSDPSIRLTFERGLSLMRVNAKYCTDMTDKAITQEVPFQNTDLANSGLGKTTTVGHWQTVFAAPDSPDWSRSKMLANAFGLIMRYSQSAARVDLSLRDSVNDLSIGQEIALTSDYIVNSSGGMGISQLTGYVLKAARSWSTPTTAYTIILPGYLSPTAKVSVWSCSGLVTYVPGGDLIEIDRYFFTGTALNTSPGAPATDATAFQLTHDIIGTWYDVQLLDQYGTFKYQGALVGVSGDELNLPGFDAYAVAGDIIVLAPANAFIPNDLDAIWDVFQADSNGQVSGSVDYARTWVR